MICILNISDSLGHYTNDIKSGNDFVLSLPPQGTHQCTELWLCMQRVWVCYSPRKPFSLQPLRVLLWDPVSHSIRQKAWNLAEAKPSLSTLPKWIYKWGVGEWDEWHGMVVHECREATKNICRDLSTPPQKYTHTFHHLNILSLGWSQTFFYLFPRMPPRY